MKTLRYVTIGKEPPLPFQQEVGQVQQAVCWTCGQFALAMNRLHGLQAKQTWQKLNYTNASGKEALQVVLKQENCRTAPYLALGSVSNEMSWQGFGRRRPWPAGIVLMISGSFNITLLFLYYVLSKSGIFVNGELKRMQQETVVFSFNMPSGDLLR